jgi:molecular chaperone HscC
MIIGIDLGTTNSLAAAWRDGAPVLIPNALGSVLTPSAVSLDEDGSLLVGLAARERLLTDSTRSVAAFKRFMGTNREVRLGRKSFRPEELSALVLRALRDDAENFLGCKVEEAVITVPAYFNDAQRKATRAAGEIAGFKVERLLNEPTAAALAYGLHEQGAERKILVLDLGVGTFDVSILEMFEGVMEVRASAGDNFLGGEDFVDVIMDGFIAALGREARIPPRSHPCDIHAALRRQAEIAKRILTNADRHELQLVEGNKTWRWTISREDFESLSEPLIARIRAPIERALRDAKLHPDQITHLVLAGGATRMPVFRRLAARLFQRLPIVKVDPDEVVARGAAVQAGLKMRDAALEDLVLTDVAPFTLGVEVVRSHDGQIIASGLYHPIIERNTVIPVSRVTRLHTLRDGQTQIPIHVFQGEARHVKDNIKLGSLMMTVPWAPAGKESVEVRFTYDASGVLEVETHVETTGMKRRLVIEGNPGVLSAAEIAERLQALAHLKIHPRDQAENRAVLARAERLYEERLGLERAVVGEWIDRFQAVLDRQDPREVAKFRDEFTVWLDSVDTTYFS